MSAMDKQPDPVSRLSAGSQAHFLEQLSDEDFWTFARQGVHSLPPPPAKREEYLVCELEDVACVLPLTAFHEAVSVPHHFTFLPDSPPWMPGLTTWHGEIIAAVDLGAYLANRLSQPLPDDMLLIAHHDDILLGLLVSSIRATTTVQVDQLTPPPETLRVEVLPGVFANAVVLDIPAILRDVAQHTGTAFSL